MQCASEAARHSSALLRRARSSIIIIHRWREGEGCRWEMWEFIHSFISPGSERAPLDSSGWGAFQKSSLVQIWLILCGSLTGGWKEPMAFLPFSCHRPHKLGRLPRPPSPLQLDPTTFLLHVAMPRHHGGAPSKDGLPAPPEMAVRPPTMFHHKFTQQEKGRVWANGWDSSIVEKKSMGGEMSLWPFVRPHRSFTSLLPGDKF